MPEGWEWDETLYLGSAEYYAPGRLPYAPGLAMELQRELELDGRGCLLDVGCGPGVITLLLAPLFEEAIGVDPDPGMLAVASRRAADSNITHIRWLESRAEDLPENLAPVRVATFAQSFHWMDQALVATKILRMLETGGALVHISDVKDTAQPDSLPFPYPPYAAINELVTRYLGPVRRAGQGVLRFGSASGEAKVLAAAGFDAPRRLRVLAGNVLTRTVDDLVAWTYSMSGSAPHLFGERLASFERDLRSLLTDASDAGRFSEQPPDTEVFIWRSSDN
jgi:SAM-dependent methyltransferase